MCRLGRTPTSALLGQYVGPGALAGRRPPFPRSRSSSGGAPRRAPSGSVFEPHAPARFGRARAAAARVALPIPRLPPSLSSASRTPGAPAPAPARGTPRCPRPADASSPWGAAVAVRRRRRRRRVKVGPDAGPDVPAGRTVLRGGPSASNNGLPARVPPAPCAVFATVPSLPSGGGPVALSRPRLRAVRQAAPRCARTQPRSRARSLSLPRPQIRRGDPLNLSILVSGGKETNQDSLSNGE